MSHPFHFQKVADPSLINPLKLEWWESLSAPQDGPSIFQEFIQRNGITKAG